MRRFIQYMSDLASFVREAWPLVRKRRQMDHEEYERAKNELLMKYAR